MADPHNTPTSPLPQEARLIDQTFALVEADTPALDALLATYGLPGAYARSHLRALGLRRGGVQAWGWPRHGGLQAVLLLRDGIAWLCWRELAARLALAARLVTLDATLLSGPGELTAPVLLTLTTARTGPPDRCPYEVLTPETFRPAAGPARLATADDMDALIDFYRHGFYSLAYLPTRAAWRARLEEQLAYRTMYIIVADQQIVAAAQSSAQTPDVAMIGGVATLPAYRNRGLSRICVSGLCTALFAGGCREIGLFYMRDNWPAAHVYRHLGFRPSGEWWLTRLLSGPYAE